MQSAAAVTALIVFLQQVMT